MAKKRKKNVARRMRDALGRTPTRTAPKYRDSENLGPGFDKPSRDKQNTGYLMTKYEQDRRNYDTSRPGSVGDRMYQSQNAFQRNVPFAGRLPEDIEEKYRPGTKKRSKIKRFGQQLGIR